MTNKKIGSEKKIEIEGNQMVEDKQDNPMRASIPILPEEQFELTVGLQNTKLKDDENLAGNKQSKLVSDEDAKVLWKAIESLEDRIINEVNNLSLGKHLITQLVQARSHLQNGIGEFDKAAGLAAEVEYRLVFIQKVRASSRKIGIPLLIYEVVWVGALLFLLYWINFVGLQSAAVNETNVFDIQIILNSLIWGGFGGVVGALYALWKHIAKEQDFDAQYALWYVTNPILGLALGGFVYLLIQAGFLSLTAGASNGETINSAAVIYVFAWICGFKQNVIYEIVRRILDVFRVDGKDIETESQSISEDFPKL